MIGNPLAAGIVAIAAIAALGASHVAGYRRGAAAEAVHTAAVQRVLDAERLAAAQAAAEATQAARDEEQRRAGAQQEVIHAAEEATRAARADADRARAAARGLRDAAQAAAAACRDPAPGDPATAKRGAPAAGPGLVLADVLGRADDAAGELAAALDAARAAGLACERSYDSLTIATGDRP